MLFTPGTPVRQSRVLAWQLPLALALVVLSVGALGGIRPVLVGFVYLAVLTGPLTRIDLAEHRLPNSLVLPGYAFAAVGLVWQWLATGWATLTPLLACAGYSLFLLAFQLAGAMGMGDVKLAGVLGLVAGSLGPAASWVTPIVAFLAGGVAGSVVLLSPTLADLRRIPFGPFMLFGFWAAVGTSP